VQHWEAEAVVDESLARELVRGQFPGVAADTVEFVSSGWDYTIHRVDREWAFRFPRRAVVLEPMQTEMRVLPAIAPQLPFAVPRAVHLGVAGERFPWPFYGSPWIPGREATGAADRAALARPLGRALRALHDAHVDGLEFDVQRRADMELRVPRAREELAAVGYVPSGAEDLFAEAVALPPAAPDVVCHGDLHFRNVLVDGDVVTGIVDWVDVCRSDPGIDLMLAYAFLAPPERAVFFDEYGPVTRASELRARVLALFLSAVLVRYARANGHDAVEREAFAALDRAVAQ